MCALKVVEPNGAVDLRRYGSNTCCALVCPCTALLRHHACQVRFEAQPLALQTPRISNTLASRNLARVVVVRKRGFLGGNDAIASLEFKFRGLYAGIIP